MEESRGLLRRSPWPTAVAAPRRAFQAHWRKAVALGLVLGASIVALAVVLAEASTSGSSGGSGGSDSSASALSLSFETEAYGVVRSNEEAIYPWRVVEPHRRTTLTAVFGESLRNVSRDSVDGPGGGGGISEVRWTITKHADGGSRRSERRGGGGSAARGAAQTADSKPMLVGESVAYTFDVVGASYVVAATVRRKRTGELLGDVEEVVRCKYVKREIRQLSREDRRALLAAYGVMYRTEDEAAGVKRFGPNFRNAKYFVTKHMDRMTLLGCSAWHSSDVFLTSHMAFNLEFDRALQAVNRSLVNAYWDYTVDDAVFGEDWYSESPIFSDDYFGADPDADAAAPTKGDGTAHIVTSGPLAYLPVWSGDFGAPEHNSGWEKGTSTSLQRVS